MLSIFIVPCNRETLQSQPENHLRSSMVGIRCEPHLQLTDSVAKILLFLSLKDILIYVRLLALILS